MHHTLNWQLAEIVPVLAVTDSSEICAALRQILGPTNWKLDQARGCTEAMERLHSTQYAVIICDQSLPEGDWRRLIEECPELCDPPRLIVLSRIADDRLWAEVLSLGAFDLLLMPLDATELWRALCSIWKSLLVREVHKPSAILKRQANRVAG